MTVFRLLRRQITRATDVGYHRARAAGHTTRGYITSFMLGAVNRIGTRYKNIRDKVVEETESQALVLSLDRDLDDAVTRMTDGKVDKTTARGSYNPTAYAEGDEFGRTARIIPSTALPTPPAALAGR